MNRNTSHMFIKTQPVCDFEVKIIFVAHKKIICTGSKIFLQRWFKTIAGSLEYAY